MSVNKEKEDPVKLHKNANILFEVGKYTEAIEAFLKAAELYRKVQNFFDAATMFYKAGESAYALKNYEDAVEYFMKSAELCFQKGFDRFGLSALEYARDCYRVVENKEKAEELEKKIKEIKEKLEAFF